MNSDWAVRQFAAILGAIEARRLFKSDRRTMLAVIAAIYHEVRNP